MLVCRCEDDGRIERYGPPTFRHDQNRIDIDAFNVVGIRLGTFVNPNKRIQQGFFDRRLPATCAAQQRISL